MVDEKNVLEQLRCKNGLKLFEYNVNGIAFDYLEKLFTFAVMSFLQSI